MYFFKKTIITRLIDETNTPYMIRWTLFACSLFTIKLHKILISDDDCLHDHPWTFISIILKGGYVEESRTGKKLYGPGSILYRPAHFAHRLEIYQPAWTLVFTSRRVKEWGFFSPAGWIPWFNYTKENACEK